MKRIVLVRLKFRKLNIAQSFSYSFIGDTRIIFSFRVDSFQCAGKWDIVKGEFISKEVRRIATS